ncbi:hypothetical protein C8D88_11685 [Lentzea atacamensis]|uniref:Uncharacterized protein n=1 Tax=Lentzea atacamensis TaxID=531938 RepID=A0A316HMY2_9PSEU|nr:hypothetical protein [Lentzea atacamensis]PWK81674.1 hypothetical protein C8D88_11685 [Lentzea atacamensis]
MIDLLPDYMYGIGALDSQPLKRGPNYVRSRNSDRWHRPRSGTWYQEGRAAFSYWCGSGTSHGWGQDEIPDVDNLCATCEGRWVGQQENRLIFTPRKALPPTTCPASRSNLFPKDAIRRFICLVCGDEAKVSGGWNRGPYVSVHKTGANLIDPCPHHGWLRLCLHEGRVVCVCTTRDREDLW